jgi:hypothetical protein
MFSAGGGHLGWTILAQVRCPPPVAQAQSQALDRIEFEADRHLFDAQLVAIHTRNYALEFGVADRDQMSRKLTTFLTVSAAGLAYRALLGKAQHHPAVRELLRNAEVSG